MSLLVRGGVSSNRHTDSDSYASCVLEHKGSEVDLTVKLVGWIDTQSARSTALSLSPLFPLGIFLSSHVRIVFLKKGCRLLTRHGHARSKSADEQSVFA